MCVGGRVGGTCRYLLSYQLVSILYEEARAAPFLSLIVQKSYTRLSDVQHMHLLIIFQVGSHGSVVECRITYRHIRATAVLTSLKESHQLDWVPWPFKARLNVF